MSYLELNVMNDTDLQLVACSLNAFCEGLLFSI